MTLLPALVGALRRLVPLGTAAMLGLSGVCTAQALCLGRVPVWTAALAAWAAACAGVCAWLRWRALRWMSARCGLPLPPGRMLRRTAAAALLRVPLTMLPVLLLLTAALLLRAAAGRAEGGLWLFAAAQAALAAVWAGAFCLCDRLGTSGTMLWLAAHPDATARQALRGSRAMLRGHRWELLTVGMRYLPAMVTVLPMGVLLPYLHADVTLFLQIRMREHEQAPSIIS